MAEALERDVVIELLNKLGSDQDEEVLAAARQAHAKIGAAGLTWEDLLVPDESDDEEDDYEDEGDDYEDEDDDYEDGDEDENDDDLDDSDQGDEVEESDAERAERNAQSLKLIEQLLAKGDVSETLREELEGYKEDIAEGEFEEGDRRYLRALAERLSKKR